MPRTRRFPIMLVIAILSLGPAASGALAGPLPPTPTSPIRMAGLDPGQVSIVAVAGGFSSPVGVYNAGDGTDRLFVVEQGGLVRVFANGVVQTSPFLDMRTVAGGLTTGGERGLLGLAFHPSFETNRKLFVYYTNGGGDLVISELTADVTNTVVGVNSADPLITIEHTQYGNHNGGHLMFGPEGSLYIFTGDGGFQNDPYESGQDFNTLLGKVLRINPDLNGGYTVPNSNPYVGAAGLDEIWSIGLRNPWKASFDRATGALWIADVGQGSWEEINVDLTNAGGRNWGWDCREGLHSFETAGCAGSSFSDPVAEYGHAGGNCSVTGGYVYRGSVFPDLVGQYVLGDYCSGRIWTFDVNAPPLQLRRDTSVLISAFGEAENGEIYMTDHGAGTLYRVVAPPFPDVVTSTFIDDITWLYYAGITHGCGNGLYCPLDSVSREQMATFIARARNLPPPSGDFFTDDETSPHEHDINRLATAGITTGCSPGLFCPKGLVSREQMASFLARALNLPSTATDFFVDDNDSPHQADINRIAQAGITLGCSAGHYCPKALVTREQMAAFLHRALD